MNPYYTGANSVANAQADLELHCPHITFTDTESVKGNPLVLRKAPSKNVNTFDPTCIKLASVQICRAR